MTCFRYFTVLLKKYTRVIFMFVGYIFWSVYQGLVPSIWFYSMFALGISGYELFALVLLSPFLVGIPGMLSVIQNRWGRVVCRLITIGSLAGFQAPTILTRLILVSIGNFFLLLDQTASLWSHSPKQRYVVFLY